MFVCGVVLAAHGEPPNVQIRPLLIGYPYFSAAGVPDSMFAPRGAELVYVEIDQFGLSADSLASPVSEGDLARLFAMPETQVKAAFARVLGQPYIPKDRPDETSDLVSQISVRGRPATAAFAFKGPGGKSKPWTLYPRQMGLRGDQAIKLFHEPSGIVVVQHVSHIAESVRHLMEALALRHEKRYSLLDGPATVRVLRRAGLFD